MSSHRLLATAALLAALAGCDQLGIESATATAARTEADGKAVGAACRHGGRAIEDCFSLNRKTDKAAIYAGWREMDDYMRENKIEAVPSTLAAAPKKPAEGEDAADEGAKSASAEKPADKAADKPAKGDKVAKAEKPAPGKVEKADKVAEASKPQSAH